MEEFLAWENLVFFLPLIGAIGYLFLFASGFADGKDMDADHDVHVDHDHDLDHSGALQKVLSVLGIGRVPVSILIMSLGMLWGFTGYACNKLYGDIWFSLEMAAIFGFGGTFLVSLLVSYLVPKVQSFATTNAQLVDKEGTVLHEVTETSGSVRVIDVHGTVLDVPARVRSGESHITIRTKVCLDEYDSGQNVFYVSRS
jgi:hypothetical protein